MVKAMFRTISKMERHIRTSFGDSDTTYRQTTQKFHGILQGNGAGPTIWVMMSSPMLDRLKAEGYGIQIELPDGNILIIPAFAFVDDVDLMQEIKGMEDNGLPQAMVQCWESSLRSTGGALVPDKCRFSVVRYTWEGNEWRINNKIDPNIQIKIKNDIGSDQLIEQIPNTSGELALGIKFSPSNSTKDQESYLLTKAQYWAEMVRTGHLHRYEAWVCLQSTIMNTLNYALPAITLSKQQLEKIMRPILDAGLSKSGICRKIARSVVYASNKHMGLGVKNPYVTQGIYKIASFFNTSQPTTLELIRATWYRMKIECGLGCTFLEDKEIQMQQIVTPGWLLTVWEFLTEYRIRLKNVSVMERPQRFPTDSYIMREVCKYKWTKNILRQCNYCRLYLQVELLSDIVTADGKNIRRNIWKGIQDQGHEKFVKLHYVQPRPGETAWSNWRTVLKKVYGCNDVGKLDRPAGIIQCTPDWKWFYNVDEDRLYKKNDEKWDVHTRILQR
jgi:hypothetical protein